jgi:hypothetical protein
MRKANPKTISLNQKGVANISNEVGSVKNVSS